MAEVIEQLRECCRDSQGREMKDFAEPWGADCGLIRGAIAEIEALRKRCEAVEADAARYQALVSCGKFVPSIGGKGWALGCGRYTAPTKSEMDAAADGAIAAAQEPSHG